MKNFLNAIKIVGQTYISVNKIYIFSPTIHPNSGIVICYVLKT